MKANKDGKFEAIEIQAVANGWIVRQPYSRTTQCEYSESDCVVFDRLYNLKAWISENLVDNTDE